MNSQRKRLDAESADTRNRLLDAGVRLFAENGFKGVSVRELCTEANANVAAIQYHFGGKEGLYQAIFETTLDDDEAGFQAYMDNINTVIDGAGKNRAQLGMALSMYIKSFFARFPFNERKRWFSVLVLRELSFPGQGFELVYKRRMQPSQYVLARIVAALEGIEANSEQARLQAHVLNGTIMSVAISRNVLVRIMDWDNLTPQRLTQLSDVISSLLFKALSLTPPQSTQSFGEPL